MLRWILWTWNRYISAAPVYRCSENECDKSFWYNEAYQSFFQCSSSFGISFKRKDRDHSWDRCFCIFHCRTLYRSRYGHEERKPDHPADHSCSACTAFYQDYLWGIKRIVSIIKNQKTPVWTVPFQKEERRRILQEFFYDSQADICD